MNNSGVYIDDVVKEVPKAMQSVRAIAVEASEKEAEIGTLSGFICQEGGVPSVDNLQNFLTVDLGTSWTPLDEIVLGEDEGPKARMVLAIRKLA